MKRADNLFNQIISDENISAAIMQVNKTHRWRKNHVPNKCTVWVQETKQDRILDIRKILIDGFVQKKPRITERYDASAQKWRTISEPQQWPDQYIHHALIQVIKPVIMRHLDPYCCGSIPDRGTYYAQIAIEKWMSKDIKGTKYQLCGDIRHFYDNLKPSVVMDRMRHIIKDRRTLDLIERCMIDGVQIGAYTSQWFANATLQPLDKLIRDSGLCKHFVRYMDNLTIFGSNKRKLRKLRILISEWLEKHSLTLKGDWQIFPTDKRLPDAVGYKYGRGYTIPRKKNLLSLKREMSKYRKRVAKGLSISPKTAHGLMSRIGILHNCSNYKIYKMIFRGERVIRELKKVIKQNAKRRILEWNSYLELRARQRSLKQKEVLTAI